MNRRRNFFTVSGIDLKFEIGEFALLTGLNCDGDLKFLKYVKKSNSLLNKHFDGSNKILRDLNENCFINSVF